MKQAAPNKSKGCQCQALACLCCGHAGTAVVVRCSFTVKVVLLLNIKLLIKIPYSFFGEISREINMVVYLFIYMYARVINESSHFRSLGN